MRLKNWTNIWFSVKKLWLLLLIPALFILQCKKDEDVYDDNNGPSGKTVISAHDFLSAEKYDKLIVEVQSVEGYTPTQAAIDRLLYFLNNRLNKPAGISISQNTIPSPEKNAYEMEDIKSIEDSNRKHQTEGSTLSAYFFFADAGYSGNSGNSKVLGIAYGSTSMVIFEETIKDHSGGIGQPSRNVLESTVINHEFGHILGLVDNGTPMQAGHQDEENGKHCDSKNCLMYYTAETTDILGNLLGGDVPDLDANCLKDLKANGGK